MLHHGARVDCEDKRGYTPLFFASKNGSKKSIITLIEKGANVNHQSNEYSDTGQTTTKKTALFRARTEDTVMLLLKYGADPTKMAIRKNKKVTAIENAIKHNIECAVAILDDCITKDPDDNLIMDFRIFKSDKGESCILRSAGDQMYSENNDKPPLLLHPLLQIFMVLKFKAVSSYFNYLQLLFQIVLTATLTSIAVEYVKLTSCTMNKDDSSCFNSSCFNMRGNIEGCHVDNGTVVNDRFYNFTCQLGHLKPKISTFLLDQMKGGSEDHGVFTMCDALDNNIYCKDYEILRIWAILVVLLLLLKELFEFAVRKAIDFYTALENWIQLFVMIFSTLFLILAHVHHDFATHSAAWMVFFAWTDFILHLARLDSVGQYIFMSIDVAYTMIILLITYLPSFFAFSFAFYVLLHTNPYFSGYIRSALGTMAMIVDDLNYSSNFEYTQVQKIGGGNISVQILFILFMVGMCLIVTNVLVAVTINKTEKLEERSRYRLAKSKTDIIIAHRNAINNIPVSIFKNTSFNILEHCKAEGDDYKV